MGAVSRRLRAAVLACIVGLAAMAAGCGGDQGASGKATLNVGYIDTSINGVGIVAVANQRKLWEKYDLNVKLVPFTDGPTQIQAMQSGQIDVGYIGGGASWLAASGQATIIGPNDIALGDYVLARPDAGIETLQDLKGKSVGFPEGGSAEMILSLALEKAGLKAGDIKRVVLTPPNVVSSFVGKKIDAAAIFSPLADQVFESVPDTVKLTSGADFPDTAFLGSWVASKKAVKSKDDALVRFLAAYADANDYRIDHPEEAVEWAAKQSGAPKEQLAAQVKTSKWRRSADINRDNGSGTTYEQFEALERLFVDLGRLESVVEPKQFVDVDLFKRAIELTQN